MPHSGHSEKHGGNIQKCHSDDQYAGYVWCGPAGRYYILRRRVYCTGKGHGTSGEYKTGKKSIYGDTALIDGADTTACMQLENMDSMYYGCVALASVQTPDSAKELSNICNGCVNLKEVHIPSAAQKMNSSFFGCTALESITGEIPSSCTDSGNLFSGCKFLSGTLTVSCTSRTTLSSSFSDAATAGTGLTIILRYDAEKSQETANTGFYGGTKSADEILNALKASMEAAFSSGSHITITTNADKTKE